MTTAQSVTENPRNSVQADDPMTKATLLTETLARASGQDAGNRQMRKAGRTRWSVDDWNTAAETTARLMVLGGLLPVECYAIGGFGTFPYARGNDGSWIDQRGGGQRRPFPRKPEHERLPRTESRPCR